MNPFERTLRSVVDPLREETRKVRRVLLVWALAALAIILGKLFPTEISALGLKIEPTNRVAIYWLLIAILGYHVLAFISYAAADAMHWYANTRHTTWEQDRADFEREKAEAIAEAKLTKKQKEDMFHESRRLGALYRAEVARDEYRLERLAQYVSVARAFVDFILPPIFAAYAIYILVIEARNAV